MSAKKKMALQFWEFFVAEDHAFEPLSEEQRLVTLPILKKLRTFLLDLCDNNGAAKAMHTL